MGVPKLQYDCCETDLERNEDAPHYAKLENMPRNAHHGLQGNLRQAFEDDHVM